LFARTKPEQKLKVINALKKNNEIVAMMGDGVNDAPALHRADIGVVVGDASDVAKESADFVLTKKSLHDLKEGIIDGRKTFGNTMKYVMMSLSSRISREVSTTSMRVSSRAAAWLIMIIFGKYLQRLAKNTKTDLDDLIVERIKKPLDELEWYANALKVARKEHVN